MKQRVVTALLLIPLVLAALFASAEWPMALLGLAIVALGGSEIARLLSAPKDRTPIVAGVVALTFGLVLSPWGAEDYGLGLAMVLWLLGLTATLLNVKSPAPAIRFAASFWVAGPVLALLMLHRLSAGVTAWTLSTPALLAIVPLWGGDTAAIFAGRAFGKHPLAPKISPKKTWEGAIANLIACVVVAAPLGIWIGYPVAVGVVCGIVAGVMGQAGDLFESFVKRKAGLKDSGTLLPGHGGVMDRIDSILFTAPFVGLVIALAPGH